LIDEARYQERFMRNLTKAFARNVILMSVVALLLSGGIGQAQDQPDTVYQLGNGVTAPKGVYMPNPEYAESARKNEDQR
jgi:hypothetical protein